MTLPSDYAERVYAGVLGKLIGVYLGRPFEGWTYERIMEHLGEIHYYVHEKLGVPLIVTDDDISGTFTFVRALEDYGNSKDVTPEQMGKGWLNYLIENDTILWWGGMGNSTEHTAYLRLKSGIPAPQSGSMELNGKVVAEQIGAQIFIDGFAMVAPGNPDLAVDLAKRAGSVSHDGEAIYGAQVLTAMESLAFIEPDIDKLIDAAVDHIPKDSVIYQMIADIREWHKEESDWRKTREKIEAHYGYDKYGGNCHMVPNHGLMIFALLYGEDDFQKTQMILNTSGWDTDCNAGNIGCLMGIKNGLAGLEAGPDFRGPVADKLYLPTADGGRAISDAVTEAFHLINMGRALAGEAPLKPKNGARFHFEMPGSVQGFEVEDSVDVRGTLKLENVPGHSDSGARSLALHYKGLAGGRVARAATPTFIPSLEVAKYFEGRGYKLLASPTLYTGQMVRARVTASKDNAMSIECRLYIRPYIADDELGLIRAESATFAAGECKELEWTVPDTDASPIAFVGLELSGTKGATGSVYLDYLTWEGAPNTVLNRPSFKERGFRKPESTGMMWKRAWVNGLDHKDRIETLDFYPETYRLIQNTGRGLISQGAKDWTDYQVTARMTPHLCKAGGVAVRAQGMRRYYAFLCDAESMKIVRTFDEDEVLAQTDTGWTFGVPYELNLKVAGDTLTASVNGAVVLEATDEVNKLTGGGVALICEEGRIGCDHVEVKPL